MVGTKDVPPTATPEKIPSKSTLAWTVAKKNYTEHELVGVRIRKRFKKGSWRNGVVLSVRKHAKVKYTNRETEEIRMDENLEVWRVAYQMYKLPSELPHKPNSSLFPRGRNSKPYTLQQFKGLIQYAEQSHGGATMEELEDSYLVRKKPGAKNTEVYGRILPCATDKIIRQFMNLKKSDVLVDIGHGIGYLCLQAAYTIGCQVRGIECDRLRNTVSQVLALRLEDPVRIHKNRDGMKFTPGSITYQHGYLQDAKHRDFLTKDVTHIFFDNYNGVFSGERGLAENLEQYVAALFAEAPEGTIMITMSPLRAALGCKPLKDAIQTRQRLGLPLSQATDASFYEVEEFHLGPINTVHSFSACVNSKADHLKAQIKCYLYLRTHQQTKEASFLCNNPGCAVAQAGSPVEAIHYFEIKNKCGDSEKAAVIGRCNCGVSDKALRMRK